MLMAMAEAMMAKGYVKTSVADVIKGAGVSRETFYQQFGSKQECFAATFEAAAEHLFSLRTEPPPTAVATTDRFEHLLGRYLDVMADHPAEARIFLIEVYAAGPEAIARRAAVQQRFVAAVADALEVRTDEGRFACETLVAAVGAMVTARLAAGDEAGIRTLREPLMRLVRAAISH